MGEDLESKEAIATLRGPVLEASERAGKRYAAEARASEEDEPKAEPGAAAAAAADAP